MQVMIQNTHDLPLPAYTTIKNRQQILNLFLINFDFFLGGGLFIEAE